MSHKKRPFVRLLLLQRVVFVGHPVYIYVPVITRQKYIKWSSVFSKTSLIKSWLNYEYLKNTKLKLSQKLYIYGLGDFIYSPCIMIEMIWTLISWHCYHPPAQFYMKREPRRSDAPHFLKAQDCLWHSEEHIVGDLSLPVPRDLN